MVALKLRNILILATCDCRKLMPPSTFLEIRTAFYLLLEVNILKIVNIKFMNVSDQVLK